jgi:hypothetical protein
VKNRVTTFGIPSNTKPHEIWIGKKPEIGDVRVFGSRCCHVIPQELKKKLEDRAREAIMIGYAASQKGYRLWDNEAKK